MKNSKKLPTKQLEKFSNIFTQLGLVLVLFIVYISLEHQTEQKSISISNVYEPKILYLEPDRVVKFVKEVKPKPKVELPKKAQKLIPDEIKKGNNDLPEVKIFNTTDIDPELINIDKVDVVKIKEDIKEDVPYDFVQYAPIFKGCENLSKEASKFCFDKKMKQFVTRNFNVELANEIGLRSGKHKIFTQFVIDDKGEVVNIKIRATHKALEKEANRIIRKLPKFKPGKQNTKTVKVRYNLPIAFSIE